MTQKQLAVTTEDILNLQKSVALCRNDAKELFFEVTGGDSGNPILAEKVEFLVDNLINGAAASAYLRILSPKNSLETDPA